VSGKKQTKVEFAHKFCQSYSVSSTFCMMKIECDILVQVLQSIERLENGRSLVISMADDQLCVEPGSELIDPQRAREPQLSDHGPRGNFLTTTGVLEVASEDEATEDEICPTSDEESEDNKAFSDFSDAENLLWLSMILRNLQRRETLFRRSTQKERTNLARLRFSKSLRMRRRLLMNFHRNRSWRTSSSKNENVSCIA
jgi:hypothetical protein